VWADVRPVRDLRRYQGQPARHDRSIRSVSEESFSGQCGVEKRPALTGSPGLKVRHPSGVIGV
jgi:hypothetical protein